MMIYPELLLTLAHERQHELIADADRARVLKSARRSARAGKVNRPHAQARPRGLPSPTSPAPQTAAVVGPSRRADGSLTSCAPRAAAPAGR